MPACRPKYQPVPKTGAGGGGGGTGFLLIATVVWPANDAAVSTAVETTVRRMFLFIAVLLVGFGWVSCGSRLAWLRRGGCWRSSSAAVYRTKVLSGLINACPACICAVAPRG